MPRGSSSSPSYRPIKKTFFLESLGCAKNQVDAEVLIAAMEDAGWQRAETADQAAVILVNSCGFIESAKDESIQTTLSFRELYPDKKIILAGCLSQRYGNELADLVPEVDGVFGNKDLGRIPDVADAAFEGRRLVLVPERGVSGSAFRNERQRTEFLSFPKSVYVKIAEGCDNKCTYCAIPLIRGDLASRSVTDIMEEIRILLDKGFFELNLIAQDLGSFGLDRGKQELPILLSEISKLQGRFWVRMLYIHPDRFPLDILAMCKEDGRILPYFDLPFQHASHAVLSRMGRKGDSATYLELIRTIRQSLPQAVIRSTFLVGFPGESEADFDILTDFQNKASLEWLGVFTYSREEGTEAYGYSWKPDKKPPKQEIARRKRLIEEEQARITETMLGRFVGKDLDVLVEEPVCEEGLCLARAYAHAPEVDGLVVVHAENVAPGDVLRVRIVRRNGVDMEAVRID